MAGSNRGGLRLGFIKVSRRRRRRRRQKKFLEREGEKFAGLLGLLELVVVVEVPLTIAIASLA